MPFEVIVVGAGPAGSTAAREIAARGHSVLLLDRATFPRDKPCGGGVSPRAAALLPFDISPVVERVVTGVTLGDPRTGAVTRDFGTPVLYMTQRQRFDAFLVDRARDAGVEVREGWVVVGIAALPDGTYRVDVEGESDAGRRDSHICRVLVGADGANGVVGRALGFEAPRDHGVALEGNLPCPDGVPAWLATRMLISLAVPGGYAWLFPKGDHVNIGVGGREEAGPRLRALFEEFVRSFGWELSRLVDVRGHHLPLRGSAGTTVWRGRAAVVGDAARLIEPLLGEGMFGAVASAIALAPVVHRCLAGDVPDLAGYEAALARDVLPVIRRSAHLASALYAWPRLFVWGLMRAGWAWGLGALLLYPNAGARTSRIIERVAAAALPPLAWLARRTSAR